jgi:hypothetical protein
MADGKSKSENDLIISHVTSATYRRKNCISFKQSGIRIARFLYVSDLGEKEINVSTGGAVRVFNGFRWLVPLCLIILSALMPTRVRADEVTLAGASSGSFSGTGDFSSNGLTFAGSSFGPISTSGGDASLGLGVFSLGADSSAYDGTFTLDVTFTQPTGLSSGGTSTFTYDLSGDVTSSGGGSTVLLDFTNNIAPLTFTDGSESGSFVLVLPDAVSLNAGGQVDLTGSIVDASETDPVPTPEPGTLLLTALGVFGLFVLRRAYGAQASALTSAH